MKIRSDYVTNSSSSSFIFKDFDRQELKVFLKKKGWEGKDDFIVKDFTAYSMDDLFEVFAFYENWLIDHILGEKWSSVCNRGMVSSFLREYFTKKHSPGVMQKLAMFYVLKVIERYDVENHGKGKIIQKGVLTQEYLEELFQWYRGKEAFPDDSFYEFFCDNYEEIYTLSQEFIGSHCGELLASLFDAKYLSFRTWQMDMDLANILWDYPNCVNGCYFMG